jgi:hypothetical protein
MEYQLELDIADDQATFAEAFFESISFVKKVGVLHKTRVADRKERQLGPLDGKMSIAFMDDFEMTTEDLLDIK